MTKVDTVNWDIEAAALLDMSVTASQSHRIAASALWNGIASAEQAQDGVLQQKVLTAKLAAEVVGALEDLGALAWSVGNRVPEGILRKYLTCNDVYIRRLYQEIDNGAHLRTFLRLPDDESLSSKLDQQVLGTLTDGMAQLQQGFELAASDYLVRNGMMARTYNKIKHGFVVVQRLDTLSTSGTPPTDWRQDVNVITGIRRSGDILYTAIERSPENLTQMMKVIDMCADAWRELALLVVFLNDRHVRLDTV